jgi:hypothetical protein
VTSPAASGVDFDRNRIGEGELIAGASGAALFVFLFFDWFAGVSAWEAFDVVDVLLAIIALGAVALAIAQATATPIRVPFAPPAAIMLGGYAAAVITLTFVLEGDGRKIGLYLALIAALGMTYGGWRAMREAGATLSGEGGGLRGTSTTTPAAPPTTATGPTGPDPVPGETAGTTPAGLPADPAAGTGTTPPGLAGDRSPGESPT